jgi:hypothetical protein
MPAGNSLIEQHAGELRRRRASSVVGRHQRLKGAVVRHLQEKQEEEHAMTPATTTMSSNDPKAFNGTGGTGTASLAGRGAFFTNAGLRKKQRLWGARDVEHHVTHETTNCL